MRNLKLNFLTITLFIFGICPTLKSQINLSSGLVAYWSFNDSTAKDNSGHKHNGVENGSPTDIIGKKGNSKFLNGNGDFYNVPNKPGLNIGVKHSISISLWMKIDSNDVNRNQVRTLISKRIGGSDNSDYIIFTSAGKLIWGTGTSADRSAWMSVTEPSINKWHHLVATLSYNPSSTYYTKHLYLDTVLIKTDSGTVKADSVTTDMNIGYGNNGGSPSYFAGAMDEIRVYNRGINVSEVKALYHSVFTGIEPLEITSNNSFEIYPNPASSILNFQLNNYVEKNVLVKIFTIDGKVILTKKVQLENGSISGSIDISGIKNGIYFIQLNTPISSNFQKLIIHQ